MRTWASVCRGKRWACAPPTRFFRGMHREGIPEAGRWLISLSRGRAVASLASSDPAARTDDGMSAAHAAKLEVLIAARRAHDKTVALIQEAQQIGALSLAHAAEERCITAAEWAFAQGVYQNDHHLMALEGGSSAAPLVPPIVVLRLREKNKKGLVSSRLHPPGGNSQPQT